MMTKQQFHASAWLMAWIITRCKMQGASAIRMHKEFFPTSCPGVLEKQIPALKKAVAQVIRQSTQASDNVESAQLDPGRRASVRIPVLSRPRRGAAGGAIALSYSAFVTGRDESRRLDRA